MCEFTKPMKKAHLANSLRLCFIGPMIGRNAGYVTTQAQIIADLFEAAGYPVISASDSTNRYFRLIDIVRTLILKHRKMDIIIINVFVCAIFLLLAISSYLLPL